MGFDICGGSMDASPCKGVVFTGLRVPKPDDQLPARWHFAKIKLIKIKFLINDKKYNLKKKKIPTRWRVDDR